MNRRRPTPNRPPTPSNQRLPRQHQQPSSNSRRSLILAGYIVFMTAALLAPVDLLPSWLTGSESLIGGLGAKDKLLHSTSFAVLGGLAVWAIVPAGGRFPWVIGLIGLLYAGLTEMLQGATGWRTSDPFDLLADAAGFVGGLILIWYIRRDDY